MNFKIDENLPTEFAELLTDAGNAAETILKKRLWIVDGSGVRIRGEHA